LPRFEVPPDLRSYLRNEHNLDLHLDEVSRLAESIRAEATDPAVVVRRIVDWAHESLEYSVIRRSPSVEEILATRQADCTEYSQLTIALARSLGIPARPVSGIHLSQGGAILHQWSEIYLDRWYEIDSTFGVTEVPAAHIRLPGQFGGFLASAPSSRFLIRSLEGTSGRRSQRLPMTEVDSSTSWSLAATPSQVLIASRDGSQVHLSRDGGRSFDALPEAEAASDSAQLLAIGDRFLWADRRGGRLEFRHLDASGRWSPLSPPNGLPLETPLHLAGSLSGLFALTYGADQQLFAITSSFETAIHLPLPAPQTDGWVLGPGGFLVQSHPSEGLVLHHLLRDHWQEPQGLDGTVDLTLQTVDQRGEVVELQVENRASERSQAFVIEVQGAETSRRSLRQSGGPLATASVPGGSRWSLWRDSSEIFLTEEPAGLSTNHRPR
jgi:hypothetical protein